MGNSNSNNGAGGRGPHLRSTHSRAELEQARQLVAEAKTDATVDSIDELAAAASQPQLADLLVAAGAIEVLIELVLDQEKAKLMQTLMMAAAGRFAPHKVAALRCLLVFASYARHRGPVAGSGILGVISALVLCASSPAETRSLAIEALAAFCVDADNIFGDALREAEFAKLRAQLVQVGIPGVLVRCVLAEDALMSAAASTLAKFVACRDMHESISAAGIVPAISALLVRERTTDAPKVEEERDEDLGPCDGKERTEARYTAAVRMLLGVIGACVTDFADSRASSQLMVDLQPRLGISADDAGAEPSLIGNLICALSMGAQRGELCESIVHCLHVLILCCHARVGLVESADLATCIKRCLIMSNNAVIARCIELIESLAATPVTAQALIAARVHEVLRQLGSEPALTALRLLPCYCNHCLKTAEVGRALLRCSRCRQANYCSAQCQRADFSSHRALCGGTPVG